MTPDKDWPPSLLAVIEAEHYTTAASSLVEAERLAHAFAGPVKVTYWWRTGRYDNGHGGYVLKETRWFDKNISAKA